jgi:hypothetical protein
MKVFRTYLAQPYLLVSLLRGRKIVILTSTLLY